MKRQENSNTDEKGGGKAAQDLNEKCLQLQAENEALEKRLKLAIADLKVSKHFPSLPPSVHYSTFSSIKIFFISLSLFFPFLVCIVVNLIS